jgi:2,4-dienoyl-CoA reductase-like NADH-dependent reductase (Old Yellow Enzyme family)
MCEYSSTDGFANDWHLVHLGSRAVGGAALIITEATAVSPEGRISPDDLGLWKDDHIEKLQQIAGFIEEHGSIAGVQLAHAGRKASHVSPWKGGKALPADDAAAWQTVAPFALAFRDDEPLPLELNKAGIDKVINDFTVAAQRALKVGFKVIEIHAAHGYLLHEFYSPLSNMRTDEYGGPFEKRIRLTVEIAESIRNIWPDGLPLFVRISASDWTEGGWTIEDSIALAKVLKGKGVDLIDYSSGGIVPHAKVQVGPGYQVPFADAIKKQTGILTGAVGMITTPQQAEEIFSSGKADVIIIAREFLRDPYFPLHAAKTLGVDVKWPVQYERAKG